MTLNLLKILPIIFLFIFGWILFAGIDLISIVSFCFIGYLIYQRKLDKNSSNFVLLISLYAIYVLALFIFRNSQDIEVFLRIGRLVVTFLGGIGLIYWLWKRGVTNTQIIWLIFLSITLHAYLMLAMYILPGLRESIYAMTGAYNIVNLSYPFLNGYRIPGLTYGLAQTSVLQGWGILLGWHLFKNQLRSKWLKLCFVFSFLVLSFSIFISGRSGIVITLLILILYFGYGVLNTGFSIKRLSKVFLSVIMVLIISVGSFLYIVNAEFKNENISYTQSHLLEIVTLFTTGESRTTDTLTNMYLIPKNTADLLFGTSTFDRSVLKIDTDVGYVRLLYHSGLAGSILYYIPFLFLILLIQKKMVRGEIKIIVLLIFISSIILHGKEVSIYTRTQWSIQILLMAPVFYNNLKERYANTAHHYRT